MSESAKHSVFQGHSDSKLHVAIIRFSSLGDVILATAILNWLEEVRDRVHISFITAPPFAELLKNHSAIDNLYEVPRAKGVRGLKKVLAEFGAIHRQRKVDLLLDMHGTLRSLAIRFAFPSIPRLEIDKRTFERWFLCTFKIDFLSSQGGQEKRPKSYGELLVDRTPRDFAPAFFSPKQKQIVEDKLAPFPKTKLGLSTSPSHTNPFIVLVPSASFAEKRWPLENFVTLTQALLKDPQLEHFQFKVVAGPEDDFCRAFDQFAKTHPQRFENLQGKTNLTETAAVVKEAALVVGNDTGVPHMAEALRVKILCLLGPTGEQFGFYPHLKDSRFIGKNIWCRPCTTNGKGNCIRSERFCLTLISPSEVQEKMKEMLL